MPVVVEVVSESKFESCVDLRRFAQLIHHPVQPVVLLQNQNDARDGLVRNWPPPADKTMMHQGYEYQRFGMAAVVGILYVRELMRRRIE